MCCTTEKEFNCFSTLVEDDKSSGAAAWVLRAAYLKEKLNSRGCVFTL